MKAETIWAESKGQEQILSREAEQAEHVLDMQGLSKSEDNITAVANTLWTVPFPSRIQEVLQSPFANLHSSTSLSLDCSSRQENDLNLQKRCQEPSRLSAHVPF